MTTTSIAIYPQGLYDVVHEEEKLPSTNDMTSYQQDCWEWEDSNNNNTSNFDLVLQDYQNAIDCLKQCETIIAGLQDQLHSKDAQIANLEEKMVHVSFELATSKAFEDEHRSKRRSTPADESSAAVVLDESTRSSTMDESTRSCSSMDESFSSRRDTAATIDESTSSRSSMARLGQFLFRKSIDTDLSGGIVDEKS